MQEQKDGLPVHDLTDIDIPPPDLGTFDLTVLKDSLGQQAAENVLLRSQVVTLSQTCQRYQQQVAALRAKVAELTPKDEEPSIPDPVCTNPDEHVEAAADPPKSEWLDGVTTPRPRGWVSPYPGADGSGA